MKSERLRLPDQMLQFPERLPETARERQRLLHQAKIGQELAGPRIGEVRVPEAGRAQPLGYLEEGLAGGAPRGGGGGAPPPAPGALPPPRQRPAPATPEAGGIRKPSDSAARP